MRIGIDIDGGLTVKLIDYEEKYADIINKIEVVDVGT